MKKQIRKTIQRTVNLLNTQKRCLYNTDVIHKENVCNNCVALQGVKIINSNNQ